MLPATFERKRVPSSTEFGSASTPLLGVTPGHSEHGHAAPPITKVTVVGALCRLPLSSTPRTRTVADPVDGPTQVYDQLARPEAGCQVLPPSVETSMPATTPPTSLAVPLITTEFCGTFAPEAGVVIVTVGAVLSLDALCADSPGCRLAGCTFMSANWFTVACCMRW